MDIVFSKIKFKRLLMNKLVFQDIGMLPMCTVCPCIVVPAFRCSKTSTSLFTRTMLGVQSVKFRSANYGCCCWCCCCCCCCCCFGFKMVVVGCCQDGCQDGCCWLLLVVVGCWVLLLLLPPCCWCLFIIMMLNRGFRKWGGGRFGRTVDYYHQSLFKVVANAPLQ